MVTIVELDNHSSLAPTHGKVFIDAQYEAKTKKLWNRCEVVVLAQDLALSTQMIPFHDET